MNLIQIVVLLVLKHVIINPKYVMTYVLKVVFAIRAMFDKIIVLTAVVLIKIGVKRVIVFL